MSISKTIYIQPARFGSSRKITGHATEGMMPKLVEKNGRHMLLADGQPFLMLTGQAHNSSAWPGMLPQL
ncbi:MAG: hypothetical protein ABIQ88_00105 [Chitinophagaceae bacterium]